MPLNPYRAAALRLAASTAATGVAEAQLYPPLTLSGSVTTSTSAT
ncbi:MAG: hypothetical protein ACOH2H_22105 [Cypionkella sp.]